MTGIVILNYNNYEDTINCVKSILAYNTARIKIVIVDNGSTREGCVDFLKEGLAYLMGEDLLCVDERTDTEALPFVTLLCSQSNSGYAVGNNKGLSLLYRDNDIDKVMILNNDTLFIQDIIPQMEKALETLPQCGFVGPITLGQDCKSIDMTCARKRKSPMDLLLDNVFFHHDIFGIRKRKNQDTYIIYGNPGLLDKEYFKAFMLSGSCLLCRKSFMYSLGGFDPNTFLFYEENILFEKVAQEGKNNYVLTGTKIIHLGGQTTKESPSLFILRCERNSMLYFVKEIAHANYVLYLMVKCSSLLDVYFRAYLNKFIIKNK